MNGHWGICYEIALRWMPLDLTDEKSTLVQVMAWCCQVTSHYLSQCWPRSMTPNGVTRPQWVKIVPLLQWNPSVKAIQDDGLSKEVACYEAWNKHDLWRMVHGNGLNFATLERHSWPFQRGSTVSWFITLVKPQSYKYMYSRATIPYYCK